MELTKLIKMLNSVGISEPTDKWIKLNNISIIYLNKAGALYPDNNRIYFIDSKNNLLYESIGNYKILSELKKEKNAYPIGYTIDITLIDGIIQTTYRGPQCGYFSKPI